ncbi:MAG: hypothetical protein PUF51_06170 [Bifidobacteriaceae bacterium]|nr:hypothetical protein [Bifidobacteriaceae bacterium]
MAAAFREPAEESIVNTFAKIPVERRVLEFRVHKHSQGFLYVFTNACHTTIVTMWRKWRNMAVFHACHVAHHNIAHQGFVDFHKCTRSSRHVLHGSAQKAPKRAPRREPPHQVPGIIEKKEIP